jgi:hypothetical protein
MLIDFENREDQAENVVNEVIEQMLVTFIDLNHGLVRGAE